MADQRQTILERGSYFPGDWVRPRYNPGTWMAMVDVAEIFTGSPGKYVSLKDTISGFKGILAGEYDHLPEQAFYMVGGIEEAVEKSKNL